MKGGHYDGDLLATNIHNSWKNSRGSRVFPFFLIDTAYLRDSCMKIKGWVYKITSPTHVRSSPHISSWKIREETLSFIETDNYEETNMLRTIRGAFEGKSVKKSWLPDLKWLQNCKVVGDLILQSPHPWGDGFGTVAYWAVWNRVSDRLWAKRLLNNYVQDWVFIACWQLLKTRRPGTEL